MGKKDKKMGGDNWNKDTENKEKGDQLSQNERDQDQIYSGQGQISQDQVDHGQEQPPQNQSYGGQNQQYGQQQNGYRGYQNPYQTNWQNQRYYGNNYSRNPQGGYRDNKYPNDMYRNYGGQNNGYPNNGYSNNGYQGNGYQNNYPNSSWQGYQPENENDNGKKSGGTGKKVLLGVCLGILISAVAAGIFFAAGGMGGNTSGKNAEEAVAETQAPQTSEVKPAEKEKPNEKEESGDAVAETETVPSYENLTDVSEIVEKTMPAVVSVNGVYTYTGNIWGDSYSEKYDGGGSGFIIGQNETELLIATNSHVVSDAEDIEVTFVDEAKADAMTKGYDNDLDVAVIAVKLDDIPAETKKNIVVAKLGNSTTLKAGQAVISIGNALLLGQSVTTGVVSAVNMPVGGGFDEMGNQYGSDDRVMIQTTAFINPGCSGGVLINASGEVVGINTMTISSDMVEGMCYAIPISDAIPVLEKLKNREIRERLKEEESGYLGISCTNVGKTQTEAYGIPSGVYISEVMEDSGAEKAGLQKGDVIVGLDGNSLKTVEELQEMLRYYPVGEKVEVEIMRYDKGDYKSQTVEVKLGKRSQ